MGSNRDNIIQMVVVMTSWVRVIDAFLNFKPV